MVKEAQSWRDHLGKLKATAAAAGLKMETNADAIDFDGFCDLFEHSKLEAKLFHDRVTCSRTRVIAPNPNYTFDPDVFPESAEGRQLKTKLVLPPGPNNPVGVAWIGLDKPGYGIHGTPSPEQVGRTESHGCFRLANWNAEYLVKLVWVGMPVYVEP